LNTCVDHNKGLFPLGTETHQRLYQKRFENIVISKTSDFDNQDSWILNTKTCTPIASLGFHVTKQDAISHKYNSELVSLWNSWGHDVWSA